MVDYEVEVPHTRPSVFIRFDSTLNENPDNESYGFNRFQLRTSRGYGGDAAALPISGEGD